MALGLADSAAVCEKDIALPVVPMFHANAWGIPDDILLLIEIPKTSVGNLLKRTLRDQLQ